MKKFAVLLIIAVLTLMVSSVAFAREPQAPQSVSTWTLSPDPSPTDGSLTTNIAFSVNDDDTTHRFCIEGSANAGDSDNNWFAIMPSSILLDASQGFGVEQLNVSFGISDLVNSQTVCPGGDRVALYTATSTLSVDTNTDYTTSVGSVIDLTKDSNVASAGTGNWKITVDKVTGSPGSLTYNLELVDPVTPDTGLSGKIVDSKTSAGWAYGAEILVTQMTGAGAGKKGSTFAAGDGTWSITFGNPPIGTDDLLLCDSACSGGNSPATYRIEISYQCNLQIDNGIRPSAASSTDLNCPITPLTLGRSATSLVALPEPSETIVPDTGSGAIQNVGNIQTDTGPTAVSLQSVTADSNTTMAVGIGFVVMMLAGVTFVMVRRREVA